MITIAFYLAIIAFFLPKKLKPIFTNISMAIAVVYILDSLLRWIFNINILFYILIKHWYFLEGFDPFYYIFKIIFLFSLELEPVMNRFLFRLMFIILNLIYYGLYIGLAFIANNVSIIKYKSDDEYTSKEINVDTNTKLIEVSAGLCTGTLRSAVIEVKINEVAKDGWKFEQMETIIGRCLLFFQRYKVVICFSKEN
mgnify:FL=1